MAQPNLSRKSRWRWVLGLSLALNLIFVGFAGGVLWRAARHHEAGPGMQHAEGGKRRGGPERAAGGYAMPYMKALSPQDRRALRQALRRGPLPDLAARRAQSLEIVAALRQEPFDPAPVATVLRAQGKAARQVQQAAQEAWLARVEAMSPEARAAYAQRVADILERRAARRRDD